MAVYTAYGELCVFGERNTFFFTVSLLTMSERIARERERNSGRRMDDEKKESETNQGQQKN